MRQNVRKAGTLLQLLGHFSSSNIVKKQTKCRGLVVLLHVSCFLFHLKGHPSTDCNLESHS